MLTTVVSATHADRVTVDAGTKALDTTCRGEPEAKGWPGLTYRRGGDEFGILTAEKGAKLPRLGDRLEFIVPHCDPTDEPVRPHLRHARRPRRGRLADRGPAR